MGRDRPRNYFRLADGNFNPRAPCGARLQPYEFGHPARKFQSTRPVWGATFVFREFMLNDFNFNPRAPCGARQSPIVSATPTVDFNPRAPCGARLWAGVSNPVRRDISIHAPRVGRDDKMPDCNTCKAKFQSTRPVWGATCRKCEHLLYVEISIHAPRVGRDSIMPAAIESVIYFNPRAPCGARRLQPRLDRKMARFQSTRPVWGATVTILGLGLRARLFQSTRPVWGATCYQPAFEDGGDISIHAPRVGRDSKFDDFTPSNLHKRYKRVLARPKNTREKGKIKQKLAYIHAFSAFLGCEGSGTFCALVLRTQYR